MKKIVSKLFLAGLFVGLLWAQGFHRHTLHEGGVSSPHVDCVVCAWAPGGHVPFPLYAPVISKDSAPVCRVVLFSAAERLDRLSFPFHSRAPPAA